MSRPFRLLPSSEWWRCSDCRSVNNLRLCAGRCTSCNHVKCPSCTVMKSGPPALQIPATRGTLLTRLFAGRARFVEMDDPGDSLNEIAKNSFEEEINEPPLKDPLMWRTHRAETKTEGSCEDVNSGENWATRPESDSETDFASQRSGGDNDSGFSPDLGDTIDSAVLVSVVDQITSTYLEQLGRRYDGQCKCATTSSGSSAPHVLPSSGSSGNTIPINSAVSRAKRPRGEQRDDSDDEESSHVRSKKSNGTQVRKIFACPYWKFDKRRYSEHNVNERHYRHCASSYGLNIHRVKQHLYRVHKRPEFYCSRCFAIFDTRKLVDDHSRTKSPCEVCDCPFEEKMTHDQMTHLRKRGTTKDEVGSWYAIYETLFPGCNKPGSPYADDILTQSVHDFEQWFISQNMILRNLFAIQIANDLPRLPQFERGMLDTILEGCLSALVRERGPYFHLSRAAAGSPGLTAPDHEIPGATVLGSVQELTARSPRAESMHTNTDEGYAAETSRSSSNHEKDDAGGEAHQVSIEPSTIHPAHTIPNEVPYFLSDAFTNDEWAMIDIPLLADDTFGELISALDDDVVHPTTLQQIESNAKNEDEAPTVEGRNDACQRPR